MPPVFGTDVRTTVLDTHTIISASGTTTTATPDSDGLFPDANPANV